MVPILIILGDDHPQFINLIMVKMGYIYIYGYIIIGGINSD